MDREKNIIFNIHIYLVIILNWTHYFEMFSVEKKIDEKNEKHK